MYDVELKRAVLELKWEIAVQRFLLAGGASPRFSKRPTSIPRNRAFRQAMRTAAGGRIQGLQPIAPAERASTKPAHGAGVRSRSEPAVDMWARENARRVREIDPAWRPRPSLTDPNSVEGAIRRAEGEAREAQDRLAELARARFGDNQGPPLDMPGPGARTGTSEPLHLL